jgi:dolichol-phosphate mannosyltransferase
MAQVGLVVTVVRDDEVLGSFVSNTREALERDGHEIDTVLVAASADVARPKMAHAAWRSQSEAGRVAAAVSGLVKVKGDIVLVVDPADGFDPEDVARVARFVPEGAADLAIASRWTARDETGTPRSWWRIARGWVARKLTGTTDPTSGLVGMSRSALENAVTEFRAVGRNYTLELVARVKGKRLDVPASPARLRARPSHNLDDLRHLKRLADHRFGDMSRLVQFCAVGASGMVVDLTTYAGLQWIFGKTWLAHVRVPGLRHLDLLAAAILAVSLALCWNFTLNRRLTFNDARAGSIFRQFVAYILSNALAVSLSLMVRLGLPRLIPFFDSHRLFAAVVGIVLATFVSFSMARWVVFRRKPVLIPVEETPRRQADSMLSR